MGALVVTGAAKGIGRAVVARALANGYKVVGLDRDRAELAASDWGSNFAAVAGDVRFRDAHERAAAAAAEYGGLVGWVNNAGVEVPGRAHELEETELRRAIDVNLVGVALGCMVAARVFVEERVAGSIVNVSSVQSVAGFPSAFAYEASKGGIDSLTRQLAVEYGSTGIRCNSVLPGCVATPMTWASLEGVDDREAELRSYAELHPLGRMAEPEEVAAAILFLLSEDASFITGVSLPVDGGATARCFRYPPAADLSYGAKPSREMQQT